MHRRNFTAYSFVAGGEELEVVINKQRMVKKVLVSQPRPAVIEKSPFYELSTKHKVEVDYKPLIRVVGVTLKEFRAQRIEILDHTAVIFTSRTTVDSFFKICEDARITVPETMKYICSTEAIALYLQKYIVYRKRKISFADGTFTGIVEQIVKHKDEKLLLSLSEPHKPEIPEALTRLKINYTPVILARTVASEISAEELHGLGECNHGKLDLLPDFFSRDLCAIGERKGDHVVALFEGNRHWLENGESVAGLLLEVTLGEQVFLFV